MFIRITSYLLFIGFLTGCATDNAQIVSAETFNSSQGAPVKARQLSAGDEIIFSVEVNGKEEVLPVSVELNFSGSVPAPLVGDVRLNAMTLEEARITLEESYSRIFIPEPMVTLKLAKDKDTGEWGYVTVLGRVRNPGRFPVSTVSGMNLSDALHEAGGFGDSANMNEITVTRNMSDGHQLQCTCDITQFGRAGSGHMDLLLFNGDIVYVPESLF
jgi:protein involved in polysaccharide export with SLBB domain